MLSLNIIDQSTCNELLELVVTYRGATEGCWLIDYLCVHDYYFITYRSYLILTYALIGHFYLTIYSCVIIMQLDSHQPVFLQYTLFFQ